MGIDLDSESSWVVQIPVIVLQSIVYLGLTDLACLMNGVTFGTTSRIYVQVISQRILSQKLLILEIRIEYKQQAIQIQLETDVQLESLFLLQSETIQYACPFFDRFARLRFCKHNYYFPFYSCNQTAGQFLQTDPHYCLVV